MPETLSIGLEEMRGKLDCSQRVKHHKNSLKETDARVIKFNLNCKSAKPTFYFLGLGLW